MGRVTKRVVSKPQVHEQHIRFHGTYARRICISEFAFLAIHCLDHCLTLCGAVPDGSTTDDPCASSYQNTVEYFRSVAQSRLLLNKHGRRLPLRDKLRRNRWIRYVGIAELDDVWRMSAIIIIIYIINSGFPILTFWSKYIVPRRIKSFLKVAIFSWSFLNRNEN